LIGNNLSFNPVVRHIKTTGGLLRRGLLTIHGKGQHEDGKSRHNTGEDELDSIHDFIATIIQSRTLDGKKPEAVGREGENGGPPWPPVWAVLTA